MDSNTLQLLGAGALIAVLGIAALISHQIGKGQTRRLLTGDVNPLPQITLRGMSPAELAEHKAFVLAQAADLDQIRWGSEATGDRQQAERTYQVALDALTEAEGDYRKFPPIVDMLVDLPRDLALSGAAAVMLRLAFLQGTMYVPEGVRAALTYTSAAIKAYPVSIDAWIMRLRVATSVGDSKYRLIANDAMRKIQGLNPNHPRFPDVESKYYFTYGTTQQYEAAVRRMIELAPSPIVKRAGYDRLAQLYSLTKRPDEAIATYQQLFREQPEGSAWTWHNYSLQLLAAQRYQEALEASNRALAFFEFSNARNANNRARQALGMSVVEAGETNA